VIKLVTTERRGMYVRKKTASGREYYQLVESFREGGKARQRVVAHLGKYTTVDKALADLPRRIDLRRRTLSRYPKSLQAGRERAVVSLESLLSTLQALRADGQV
jgi:hypothetical protein